MKLSRRHFLHAASGAAALQFAPRAARAQVYPSRPIRLIVTFGAGTAPDIIARLIGQWLSERLGQQFVIENRPGFGGNIATEYVVRAAPDGYTLLIPVSSNAANATLYPNLSFNFIRDIAPVAGIATTPFVGAVPTSFPAKTLPDLIAYAKANPGKINMGSPGNGSSNHIFGEMFKIMAGVNLVHVPYRTGLTTDLVSGQVQFAFIPVAGVLTLIQDSKLRALAVTPVKRMAALPDVPAVSEFVPGYEAFGWYGLGAPKNTPAEIIDKLSSAMSAALADQKVRARLVELGVEPMTKTAAEFGRFIGEETDKWAKVINSAGVKAD